MEKTKISQLLPEIMPIYVRANQVKEEKRKRGEYFNVFNTIGLRSEEVRLHSAFVAELLNPDGSHGVGDSFLKEFLYLFVDEKNFVNSSQINPAMVERSIGKKNQKRSCIEPPRRI